MKRNKNRTLSFWIFCCVKFATYIRWNPVSKNLAFISYQFLESIGNFLSLVTRLTSILITAESVTRSQSLDTCELLNHLVRWTAFIFLYKFHTNTNFSRKFAAFYAIKCSPSIEFNIPRMNQFIFISRFCFVVFIIFI